MIVLDEVERLTRLFQNILDMARIEAGAVAADARWVHPVGMIVGGARSGAAGAAGSSARRRRSPPTSLVKIDPRLTAAALSHLLENAAQYSPAGASIEIAADVAGEEARRSASAIVVRVFARTTSRISSSDSIEGWQGEARAGSGMGLSIAAACSPRSTDGSGPRTAPTAARSSHRSLGGDQVGNRGADGS